MFQAMRSLFAASVALGAMLAAGEAAAGGFFLRGNSAYTIGTAFAGQSTGVDPATVVTNPAGMTRFRGLSGMGSLTIFAGGRSFDGGSRATLNANGAPVSGFTAGPASDPVVVPFGYAIYEVHPDWRVGAGLHTPFGLTTDWNFGWYGRYQAQTSRLVTINLNPAVAWQPVLWLSVGAGLQVQRASATLSNSLDTGAAVSPGLATALDSFARVNGTDWAFGWSVGVLLTPTPNLRAGLSWRSAIDHTIRGDADFTLNPALAGNALLASRFSDRPGSARLLLPATLSVGVAWDVLPDVTLLGEFQWQNWSRFRETRIVFATPAGGTPLPDSVTVNNYRDTVFVSVGGEWRVNEMWAVRAGLGWDQSPTRDGFRSARLPDGDRIVFGVGTSIRLHEAITLDLALAHFFTSKESIVEASTTTTLRGRVTGDYTELAAALRIRW
jgi:long-chain fatty acid transport protein